MMNEIKLKWTAFTNVLFNYEIQNTNQIMNEIKGQLEHN